MFKLHTIDNNQIAYWFVVIDFLLVFQYEFSILRNSIFLYFLLMIKSVLFKRLICLPTLTSRVVLRWFSKENKNVSWICSSLHLTMMKIVDRWYLQIDVESTVNQLVKLVHFLLSCQKKTNKSQTIRRWQGKEGPIVRQRTKSKKNKYNT